jgi:hypothetical protein
MISKKPSKSVAGLLGEKAFYLAQMGSIHAKIYPRIPMGSRFFLATSLFFEDQLAEAEKREATICERVSVIQPSEPWLPLS